MNETADEVTTIKEKGEQTIQNENSKKTHTHIEESINVLTDCKMYIS